MVEVLGVGLAVLAAVLLAGQAVFVRLATRSGSVLHVLLVALVVNAFVLVPLAVVFDAGTTLTLVGVGSFIVAGLVSMMTGRMFYYGGIKRVGAARAEPLKSSMPLFATIFAIAALGEVVVPLQFFGILLIVAGIAVVSWEGARHEASLGAGVDRTGMAYPLIAAVLFGLEPIAAVVGFSEGTPILVGAAIKSTAAAVVLTVYLGTRGNLPDLETVKTHDFRWYLAAGIASVLFMLAYYAGLSVSRVAVVVPIMQTSPLVVSVVSALFLGRIERVSSPIVVGSAIVVVGGGLVTIFG